MDCDTPLSGLNPFTDIAARDWLSNVLWTENPPDLETEYLLLGDRPFAAAELSDFLRRHDIDILFNDEEEPEPAKWDSIWLPRPPCVVLGRENVFDTSEFQSLVSGSGCGEEPTQPLGELSDIFSSLPYWIERINTEGGIYSFRRSRNLEQLRFISQEMLLANLFFKLDIAELPDPWLAHAQTHPVLRELKRIQEGNRWEQIRQAVHDRGWPPVGLLKHFGYTVGVGGTSESERRSILEKLFNTEVLPKVISEIYIRGWGDAQTATRLKKMADSITAFCRNAKAKRDSSMNVAIESWESDLLWLRRSYYDVRLDGKFHWPKT